MGFLSHFSSQVPHFYDVKWLIFETLWPGTQIYSFLFLISLGTENDNKFKTLALTRVQGKGLVCQQPPKSCEIHQFFIKRTK